MNIAILTIEINAHSGSRAPLELAVALAKRSHRVTIIALAANCQPALIQSFNKKGIDVKFIKSGGLAQISAVFQKLKRNKYQIVSFHANLPVFLGAKLTGLPIVRTYYGTQFDAVYDKFFPAKSIVLDFLNRLGNLSIWALEYFMLSNSREIVAISKFAKTEVQRLYHLPAGFCYLGTKPIASLGQIKKTQTKKTLTILSVSRLIPYKGFHKLISTFTDLKKSHPFLKLQIVGRKTHAAYFTYLKSLCGPGISITTDVSDKQLTQMYFQSDIYATYDRYPFFGLPILEAQASGLPVVCLDTAAAQELVMHAVTGFVATSNEEFSQYLTQLIDNPQLRFKMGRAAAELAKNFSWDKTARFYENKFQKII